MAVNRDKVKKQMAQQKQRSGKFRYLPKDSTTALRILEFIDDEGDTVFARPVIEHREVNSSGGKALGICREETFGQPCAFCRVNQKRKDSGDDWLYEKKTRFAVNGIDVNDKSPSVRKWMLPVTAYEQISEYVMDEEYADVLEQEPGLAFNCKREGSGLDTTYTCKPKREPWPVSDELMKQVSDPLDAVADVGLKAQCEELGYEISELFDDSEIEEAGKASAKTGSKSKSKKSTTTKKTTKKKTAKKKSAKKKDKAEAAEIGVGSPVKYEDEDVVYHVKSIDGNNTEIEDDDQNVYEATMDQLSLITDDAEPAAEPEPEPEPEIEVGSEVHYQGEEDICTVKSIKGDKIIIEDGEKEQYDCTLEDLALAAINF